MGEYPEKYRPFIWRYLLGLPTNKYAYDKLVKQGPHTSWKTISKTYPLKSKKLELKLIKCLSTLSHWCEVLSDSEWLPNFVFPFLNLFEEDIVIFEILASILSNWCQH